METKVQIFEHEEFGKIRWIMKNGEPHFFADDICHILDLGNVTKALYVLDDDEKSFLEINPVGLLNKEPRGSKKKIWLVNEFGLYRLIMSSRMPKAKDFQRWVYHEVLPAIRKHGYYSLTAEPKPAPVSKPASTEIKLNFACVYILLMSDGTVKIGHTGRLRARVAEIERQTGLTVNDFYFTLSMSREDARFIEWACQKKFSSRRKGGEFFSISFDEACAAMTSFVKVVGSLRGAKNELGNKLLAIAGMMTDSAEKQSTLAKANKLLVGRTLT